MKRILTIPLLFIYIIAVSGVMIQLHYCGQELESWNMFAQNKGCGADTCTDGGTEDGCCKDKVIAAKVIQDQNTAPQLIVKVIDIAYDIDLPVYAVLSPNALQGVPNHIDYHPNAPPGLWQHIPLYKLYSNFTYYG